MTEALPSRDDSHLKTEHRSRFGRDCCARPGLLSQAKVPCALRWRIVLAWEKVPRLVEEVLLSRDMGRARCGFDALRCPILGFLARCGDWVRVLVSCGLGAWILVPHRLRKPRAPTCGALDRGELWLFVGSHQAI